MIQKSHDEQLGRAAAWLILGIGRGLMLDLCTEELLRTYSLQQFVLLRSLIGISILLAIAPRSGGLRSLRSATRHR